MVGGQEKRERDGSCLQQTHPVYYQVRGIVIISEIGAKSALFVHVPSCYDGLLRATLLYGTQVKTLFHDLLARGCATGSGSDSRRRCLPQAWMHGGDTDWM